MQLETLYKRSKTGAIQYWKVSVLHDTIFKESGQLGTKNPVKHEEICERKNRGRANETSPAMQAELQAESDWKKKRDEGYKSLKDLRITLVPTSENRNIYSFPAPVDHRDFPLSSTEETDNGLEVALHVCLPKFNTDASGNVKPMLATDWKKIKKIDYPVLVQPKLDGVRCLMVVTGEDIKFLSRNGKGYTTLEHIAKDVWDLSIDNEKIPDNFILDGEIYSDELTFQEITQAVKKQYPNSLKLHFRAYDVISESSQEDRVVAEVREIVNQICSVHITHVDNHWCKDEQEVKDLHDKFVQEGYEGAMIRLPHGKYEQGARSHTLLKVKEFDESECKFLRWEYGQREEDLLAVLETTLPKGRAQFRAKMIGTRKEKEEMATKQPSKITIKHFGYTTDGLPRFPIGKAIRDYE